MIGLYPVMPMPVYMNTFNGTRNTLFMQPSLWMTVKTFRNRIHHRIVYTVINPKMSLYILLHVAYIIAKHAECVVCMRVIHFETITVIAVKSIGRAYPHKSTRVTSYAVDLCVLQTVSGVKSSEFHIRNYS